jgi:enoyl-CoA hydratase
MLVLTETDGPVAIITINRPEVRNAVNRPTAEALAQAFREFENNPAAKAAVLTGAGGHFCAGADLKSLAVSPGTVNRLAPDGDAPMGPSRMVFSKPVIAAVAGFAVAGGLELALMCDLRVAEEEAVFGVFCRRWGVPLIDGGTVRLPRLIGLSRALDMILTGRPVSAGEALSMGLANRVVPGGTALSEAVDLAKSLAAFPQNCLRSDRQSAYEQADLSFAEAMANEFGLGLATVQSGETLAGAGRFADGAGRHGKF